ncbi:MAG TPA: TM2 domain-containing protein [Solirubrobacteraceae bacterium]|jgi:TM2 domain-containing membrane protein YozV
MSSNGVAYLLWLACCIGFCGIHRFYLGKPISGLLWLFTLGLLGFGQLLDLVLIPGMVESVNRRNSWGRGGNHNTNVVNVHVGDSGRSRGPRDDFDFR